MGEKQSSVFLGGIVVGAALGAVAGLLLAPRSGRETRGILRKSADALPEMAEDLATTVQLHADLLSETALVNWDRTLERLRAAIAAGQAASRQEYIHLTTTSPPQLPRPSQQNQA